MLGHGLSLFMGVTWHGMSCDISRRLHGVGEVLEGVGRLGRFAVLGVSLVLTMGVSPFGG